MVVATRFLRSGKRQQPPQREIWMVPAESGEPRELYGETLSSEYSGDLFAYTAPPAFESFGALVFSSDRGGAPQVWRVDPASGDLRALSEVPAMSPAPLPGGNLLMVSGEGEGTRIVVLDQKTGALRPWLSVGPNARLARRGVEPKETVR
jgi:hypothetical protein